MHRGPRRSYERLGMSRRGGSRSSFGVAQIVIGAAVLLGVGIALAFMFAPEKPAAPPTSKVTYKAESPREKKKPVDGDLPPLPEFVRGGPAEKPADTAPAAAPEAPPEKPFRITGTVIDLRAKTPLPEASVTVRRQWTPAEQKDWEAREAEAKLTNDQAVFRALREERNRLQLSERARTNAEGRFEIGLDVPGQYELEAVHRRYVRETMPGGVVNSSAPVSEVQVGLSTGATISGRVTEIGSPTPAVEVRVVIEKDGVHSARTDEKGEYKIEGLTPGDYGVLVNTAGSAYKPGPTLPYQRVSITSNNQDLRGIDFEVEAAGVVWGYVRTPDGQPVKGAEVLLTSPQSILSQAITSAIRQAPPVRGRSEDDGYYELLGVPINSEWRVYATSSDASPQLAEPFMLTSEVRSVQIDVFLFGGSDLNGIVLDNANQPVADAQVACIPSYSKMLSPMDAPQAFREAKSGPDGTFTISKLPAGDYQLLARKAEFKIPTVGVPVYPDGYSVINGVEVRLLPVDEGRNWVEGTVTDVRTREPVSGATVTVGGFGSETLNNFTREASSDAKGYFRIDGLEAGTYRLRVEKEGYAPKTIPRVLLNQETPVALNQSAVVRGVVLVREGNRPPAVEYTVSRAYLTDDGYVNPLGGDDGMDPGGTSFNNSDGSYQLFLSPGNYQLEARAAGYTRGRETVSVAAGQVLDGVNIYLSEGGGSIGGQVTAPGSASVRGTTVRLYEQGNLAGSAGGGAPQPQTLGDDGYYQFDNLSEGSYYAVAENPNYANAKSRVANIAGDQQVLDLDIKLGSGGWIEGVVRQAGRPQPGATVIAASAENTSAGQAVTESDGSYYIEDLGAGEYTVTWIPAGTGSIGDLGKTNSRPATVTEGRGTTVNFGVDGANLQGQCSQQPLLGLLGINMAVLQPVGSPLLASPGQSINPNALTALSGAYTALLDPAGKFVFEGIPEGTYQLSIFFSFPTGGGGGPGGGQELRMVGFNPQVPVGGGGPPVVFIETNY